jgi:hypothetical protein
MTTRRFVLWLTGRDLLAPPRNIQLGEFMSMSTPMPDLWQMTLAGKWNSLGFNHAVGPNVIHRLLQRVMLGSKIEQKASDGNKKLLAEEYSVIPQTIGAIIRRENWNEI